jgi:hypothetical protein
MPLIDWKVRRRLIRGNSCRPSCASLHWGLTRSSTRDRRTRCLLPVRLRLDVCVKGAHRRPGDILLSTSSYVHYLQTDARFSGRILASEDPHLAEVDCSPWRNMFPSWESWRNCSMLDYGAVKCIFICCLGGIKLLRSPSLQPIQVLGATCLLDNDCQNYSLQTVRGS